MENNNENLKNSNSENSSFFEQKVSSSNGNEDFIPKLRFKEFCKNWSCNNMGSFGTFTKGAPLSKADISETGFPFILYGELYTTYKEVTYHVYRQTDANAPKECFSNIGDVIIPTSGETPEEIATATCVMVPNVILGGDLNIYRNNAVDGRIISYIINHKINKCIAKVAQGKSVVHIKADDLSKMNIIYPEKDEQAKIINFLWLIDKRIEKQRQLVESLKKYKRGLLSAIFERKIRFKDDNGNDYPEWNKIPLGSIFVERVEKVTGNEELLSVTINEGIKKRNTIDIKDNSSENKSHYKKVYKDDIAYNTMRMWQGASGVSKYNGMVSPAYTVISPKIDVNIDFWSYYLKYYKIIHLFQKFSQGLTSDTWNLKFPQFAEIKVLVPSKVEQEKLAEILLTFDNNINIYQNYLDKLEQLKKSLLQQMFI